MLSRLFTSIELILCFMLISIKVLLSFNVYFHVPNFSLCFMQLNNLSFGMF